MRFSILLATVDRTKEVAHFLAHLDAQTWRDFELIVVDQNSDDLLAEVLDEYALRFPILRVRSGRGHSRALNVGLAHASGDVVAFPDDDCWYDPDLLARVAAALKAHPDWSGLTGREITEPGFKSGGHWDSEAGPIKQANVWWRGISFSIFLRRSATANHEFDESLGVGAGTPWGAGEETDYLLRLMARGHVIHYDPTLTVWHQGRSGPYTAKTFSKARSYGMGVGRVLRKNRYPLMLAARHFVRPAGGALLALASGNLNKAYYHWSIFSGRVHGWLAKPEELPRSGARENGRLPEAVASETLHPTE